MFSKTIIVLVSATLIASAAAPAHAYIAMNGGGENGLQLNGGGANGTELNGNGNNGTQLNGGGSNGTGDNGAARNAKGFAIDRIELPARR